MYASLNYDRSYEEMTIAHAEAKIVGKSQKTVYLDDDLISLLQAQSKASGASLTRMITAAVIQYLFTNPDGPIPYWMEFAVSLELADIDVGMIPRQRKSDSIADELARREMYPGIEELDIPDNSVEMDAKWRKHCGAVKDDPIPRIIAAWTDMRKK